MAFFVRRLLFMAFFLWGDLVCGHQMFLFLFLMVKVGGGEAVGGRTITKANPPL